MYGVAIIMLILAHLGTSSVTIYAATPCNGNHRIALHVPAVPTSSGCFCMRLPRRCGCVAFRRFARHN